jgi:hypothetical protein
MKRTILSLALAAALVLPVAVSHVRPVAADYSTNVICPMLQPAFSGTPADSHYFFLLACAGNQTFQVSAYYTAATRQASEQLTGAGASAGQSVSAAWTCPSDPWGTEVLPACTNSSTTFAPAPRGFLAGYNPSASTLPYSAQSLNPDDHALLATHPEAPTPPFEQRPQQSQGNTYNQHINSSPACVGCGNLFGTPGDETTQADSTVCVTCLAAAGGPSPTTPSGRPASPAPVCQACQLPGR